MLHIILETGSNGDELAALFPRADQSPSLAARDASVDGV